jgi:oligo-1,6-glucosidase
MMENGATKEEALAFIAPRSRDNARTPYQWDDSENAGFTTGKPWLKVNPRYKEINLAADRKSPDSIFAFYQQLIRMRAEHPAILDGDLEFLLDEHEQMVVYLRRCARETLLVIANDSGERVPVKIPETLRENEWNRILTKCPEEEPSLEGRKEWLPWEVEVYELTR